MIKVAVNGYNVIGRRVADAVAAQGDMSLVGISKVKPDYKARNALERGYKVFTLDEKGRKAFSENGIETSGLVSDLVQSADIVIDCTPEDAGAENKALYKKFGKKAIFQGGEEHSVAEMSFVAQCNYDVARGKDYVRVVSCNTTGLCRILHSIDESYGIRTARVVIARRAADPDEVGKGPIDAIVLDPISIPSHHGPDVNTVLPNFPVISMALKVPTTHMHLHSLIVTLKERANQDDVAQKLEKTQRIMLVNGKKDGFKSTASIMDYARDLRRPRNDMYEAVVWRDSVKVIGDELYLFMAVHQEAIVIPENIDAVRAVLGTEPRDDSIRATNRSLGIMSK